MDNETIVIAMWLLFEAIAFFIIGWGAKSAFSKSKLVKSGEKLQVGE